MPNYSVEIDISVENQIFKRMMRTVNYNQIRYSDTNFYLLSSTSVDLFVSVYVFGR